MSRGLAVELLRREALRGVGVVGYCGIFQTGRRDGASVC